MKTQKPFGSWNSPVTPEFVAGKDRVLTASLQVDGNDIYFIELRPDERGRAVLMRRSGEGLPEEVLPKEFNVRTRYLEYGGLSFFVSEKTVYFVNFADQEVYAAQPGQAPKKLTNQKGERFADFALDKKRKRLLALREKPGQPESRNSICAIDLTTGKVEDLISGEDFYGCPRVNGDRLLWISWNHPNMPWNGTELWTATFDRLDQRRKIAGDKTHAVAQAQWAPDESIYFIAELNNFMNLYRNRNGHSEAVFARDAEFALPDWVPGNGQYAFSPDGSVCATYIEHGRWHIVMVDRQGQTRTLHPPFATVGAIRAYGQGFVAIVGHGDRPTSLVTISAAGEISETYSPGGGRLDPEFISLAQEVRYPTADGGEGYAWLYLPKNPDFSGMPGEKPPLVVSAHGGPTAMSFANFRKDIQFWTTRGYAFIDVNYGGSTGYGRAYRERLRDKWGIVDIEDCVAAVRYLIAKDMVDPARVAIRGGSAGGYTTLAALTFTKEVFKVGASYFGVSDPELLAKETHKFESRYLDQLIGPYPAALKTYQARSPLAHTQNLDCPIVFFQGDEDKVVLPNQSELMHEALKKKKIPTEYHLYKEEGHGFMRAETLQHALKAEHSFYARFFGFEVRPEDKN